MIFLIILTCLFYIIRFCEYKKYTKIFFTLVLHGKYRGDFPQRSPASRATYVWSKWRQQRTFKTFRTGSSSKSIWPCLGEKELANGIHSLVFLEPWIISAPIDSLRSKTMYEVRSSNISGACSELQVMQDYVLKVHC